MFFISVSSALISGMTSNDDDSDGGNITTGSLMGTKNDWNTIFL